MNEEVETCPKCGYYGLMTAVGRLGSTDKRYVISAG